MEFDGLSIFHMQFLVQLVSVLGAGEWAVDERVWEGREWEGEKWRVKG